tara:strand:- start:166 stop:669 length:504 start_codon:yes stop_codon:yes gene_type:complete
MLPIIRKVTIALKVDFDGTKKPVKINFNQDIEELRNVRLWGIQTYFSTANSTASTLTLDPDYGRAVISRTQFQGAFLNLYDIKNVNFLINCPFAVFGTLQNGNDGIGITHPSITERDAKNFNGQYLDIQSSFVIFDGSVNGVKDNTRSIVIDIYYSRTDLDAKLLKN